MIPSPRPLTPSELETLLRFDRWCRSLFTGFLDAFTGRQPPFSSRVHPDQRGNLMIDNGRMLLVPPFRKIDEWNIVGLEGTPSVNSPSLEEVLLKALSEALRRNFINRY